MRSLPAQEPFRSLSSKSSCQDGIRSFARRKKPEKLAWAYRRLAATVRFFARIEIVDFDEVAIRRYGLKKLKLNVRKMDLRIAATVLERDGILVTRNLHDFQQVPGLQIED